MLESEVLILFNSKCEVREGNRKEMREMEQKIFVIFLGSPYKERAKPNPNMTLVPIEAFLVHSPVLGCSSQISLTLPGCACISSALQSQFQMSFLPPPSPRAMLDHCTARGKLRKGTKNLPGPQEDSWGYEGSCGNGEGATEQRDTNPCGISRGTGTEVKQSPV